MKIIEAMKRIKANKKEIEDLKQKISQNCAHLDYETPQYEFPSQKINEWSQGAEDLAQENIRLLCAIARTNLATKVDIELGGKIVTKSIAEWIWRRREYAKSDYEIFRTMSDRGLKEHQIQTTTGIPMVAKLVRNFDANARDKKLEIYGSEARHIDAKLEVINCITDLIE